MEELKGKILKWLDTQGYPLEMSVALEFQKAGFRVSLSDVYTDYESSSQREIDVTAIRWSDMKAPAALEVAARIECKSSKDKPWIIFISQAQPETLLPFEYLCSSGYRNYLAEFIKQPKNWDIIRSAPLLKTTLLGHGLIQAFKDQQDLAYSASYSSVKASIYRAMQFDSPDIIRASVGNKYLAAICFPMIVIDARLFECYINEKGASILREVETSTLIWRNVNPIVGATTIPVATLKGLPELITNFSKTCEILINCVDNSDEMLAKEVREANESILRNNSQATAIG
jgi:hypothetical protein